MPKNTPIKTAKNERRELAIKKAKRKKLIMIGVGCIALIALLAFIIVSAVQHIGSEVYGNNEQTVTLLKNGNFNAKLAHSTAKGTYTKTVDGNKTIVTFNVDGTETDGLIENDQLSLPEEWSDDHGHGSVLPKK